MIKQSLRLLIIEDNESDAALLERHLHRAGIKPISRRVDTQQALLSALAEQSWDLVLSDYNLPGFDALSALRLVRKTSADVPFIVVSGMVGEEAAVELMQAGAQDYVSKDRLSRLIPAIERELKEASAHRKQRRLSARLRAQDERFKLALSATGDGVWERDLHTQSITLSDQWKAMLGYEPIEIGRELSAWRKLIHPDDVADVDAALQTHRSGNSTSYVNEHRLLCKDGSWKWVLDRGVVIRRDPSGVAMREIGTMTDISKAKHIETLLRSSDAVLRKLSSQVPGMLYQFQMDPNGQLSMPFVSESVRHLYELEAEEICADATAILARVHPDDRASLDESIGQSAATMQRWKHEHRVVLPSKGIRWMSGESQPERLADGTILWHGFIHDITERKTSDAQLRLLQACVNQLNDTIMITEAEPFEDPGPRIVYVNPAFEKQTGYSAAEAVGETPRILQGKETDRDELHALGERLRKWQPCRSELLNYTKDGRSFWAELDFAPVADSNGRYTHWISVQRDATERKRAELEREQLIEELETRHAELNAYNQWVAHDLRNPIIAVSGLADLTEMALDDGNMSRARDCVQRILETAKQADKLIKSLMTVAKLGRSGICYNTLSVQDAVQSVLDDLQFMISTQAAEITLKIPAKLSLLCDQTLLRVILRNLISNAVRHRHPDRRPEVEISAQKNLENEGIEIRVRDNGAGIEQHFHSRVFVLFERMNSGTDGIGLGLAMVDRAARLLYGRAQLAYSETNVGSCFSVWLPSEQPAPLTGSRTR